MGTFTPELTFGQYAYGTMSETPGITYKTIQVGGYTNFAVAFAPMTNNFWVAGTQYGAVSSLPGYSFSRSGEQGALDASGVLNWYAANVPAINSAGFHSYAAVTNIVPHSYDFTSGNWTIFGGMTKVSTNNVGPDGATNAANITWPGGSSSVAHQFYYNVNYAATGLHTVGVMVKSNTGGNQKFRLKLFESGLGDNPSPDLTATTSWQLFLFTANCVVGVGNVAVINAADASAGDIQIAQVNVAAGSFTTSMPLIRTNGATASIGESLLSATVNPYTTDQDFIMWAKVYYAMPPSATQFDIAFVLGPAPTTYPYRNTVGAFAVNDGGATTNSGIAALATAGTAVLLYRRRAGKDTICVRQNGVTNIVESGGVAYGNPTSFLAFTGTVANTIRGISQGVFALTGTYSDAQITSIVESA